MIDIFFDGSFQAPDLIGFGAYAVETTKPFESIWEQSSFQVMPGGASCNVAEYQALMLALDWLLTFEGSKEVRISGDSKLVIKQMQGRWRVKEGLYTRHADNARGLLELCKKLGYRFIFRWIPRQDNKRADELSRPPVIQRL